MLLNTVVWRIDIYLQIKVNFAAVYTIFIDFFFAAFWGGCWFVYFKCKLFEKNSEFLPWNRWSDRIEGVVALQGIFTDQRESERNSRKNNNKKVKIVKLWLKSKYVSYNIIQFDCFYWMWLNNIFTLTKHNFFHTIRWAKRKIETKLVSTFSEIGWKEAKSDKIEKGSIPRNFKRRKYSQGH